ncbi:hypothetical protein JYT84_00220 [bacterium AH-315-M10]|nr:hypothetical protein [bacterium AH-315-M10]
MTWLWFSLMTVASWGVYGIFLHKGVMSMGPAGSPPSADDRYKAFLFVGLAYFLTAVLAPIVILLLRGADWNFSAGGMRWSLLAGIVGAIGAFCVLLAFGAKGSPAVVMSIIFAGAPVVNAAVVLALSPPEGGYGSISPAFYAGILLAAIGGCLVTLYKPGPAHKPPEPAAVSPATQPDR